MAKKLLYVVLAASSLCACQSEPISMMVNVNKPVPALLTSNNGDSCYQQLSLREAINHPVHVSLDVFSTSSTMFLEPVVQRNVDGTRKDGMIVDKPNQFKLELVRQQCLLTQVNKQWQSSLPLCLCQSSYLSN